MLYVQRIIIKMDSFELNKIIAAVLMVVFIVFGISKFSDLIFDIKKPDIQGYKVEIIEKSKSGETSSDEIVDMSALFAMVNIEHGKKVFKKCAACHSVVKGGGNKIGPKLYNVVGRKSGAVSEYKYSKALISYNKEWSFAELNGFLLKPSTWIKGNKMGFGGLKKEKDRASVIMYLNQNGDNPIQLP